MKIKVVLSVMVCTLALLGQAQNISKSKKIGDKIFLISGNNLLVEKGGIFKEYYKSGNPIVDITQDHNNEMVIMENREIKIMHKDGTFTTLKHDIYKPFFTNIYTDTEHEIWVGTLMSGAYKVKNDSLKPFYDVQYINQIIATRDSSLWIATNIGLHRLKGNTVTVFKEEGTANYEISDNYVEQLIVDNLGDLWIKMPEAISVFPFSEKTSHEHLPTVKFIGTSENVIYNISFHKNLGYLISSKEGLLLLPVGNKEDNHKFFEMAEEKAKKNPNINLNIIKRGFFDGKALRPLNHFFIANNKIRLVDSFSVTSIKVRNISFR